ncbi:phosphotransferase family protein [Granulosicoccus antarcticus]|uniref:Methylthioribose kinase n=1 Tax=Granulosicoccus antarcticus IMCC3135 TaxID=1192854 RepID=A0A2Z2NPN9_9GAMM|nr:aminoglycoside phosphotransferase family protein [Granulosicoccus antarcticus]ASJ73416.1 Methylthioribose kinase [Granulosicoccus antarcticus IMCC3135]
MSVQLEARCRELISELGLGEAAEVQSVHPLTGGVSSDIARVVLDSRQICIKFAIPKLKVAEDWHAPVHRNAAEYRWLQTAADILPSGAVQLLGRSEKLHGFAMEFISGDDVYLWKSALLAEAPDHGEATAVGDILGRIHAASSLAEFDTSQFHNRDDFRALRIEPYLSFTALQHSELATHLDALACMLYQSEQVLVHGDVSPKNILFRTGGPVMLDAECATMGDASFDPSFCLNHLVLKAALLPDSRARLLANAADLWRAYAAHISWEPAEQVQTRICSLLPALMLARIDGKSPVEYLDDDKRRLVRKLAIHLIRHPVSELDQALEHISTALKEHYA